MQTFFFIPLWQQGWNKFAQVQTEEAE